MQISFVSLNWIAKKDNGKLIIEQVKSDSD
jgi:hypothetical protein